MLYWIMDANDMQYVNRTHAQTKFSIEHTSVGLAHAHPITSSTELIGPKVSTLSPVMLSVKEI